MHSCPDCGQACYCNGDIDDLRWGDDSDEAMHCVHFEECEQEDSHDDFGEFDDEPMQFIS